MLDYCGYMHGHAQPGGHRVVALGKEVVALIKASNVMVAVD